MEYNSSHVRLPLRPFDPESSPSHHRPSHKGDHSQTLGATFVSTAVVPAPSTAEVLSSLISSLTILSDSARKNPRSNHEREQSTSSIPPRTAHSALEPAFDFRTSGQFVDTSTEQQLDTFDYSEGEEAEPPAVGYTRPRTSHQKKPSFRERLYSHGSNKDKAVNASRSASSQTVRRTISVTSFGIGIPSIERGYTGSSTSLRPQSSVGTKSPLNMSLPLQLNDSPLRPTSRLYQSLDATNTQVAQMSATNNDVDSSRARRHQIVTPEPQVPAEQETPAKPSKESSPEHKIYSPLSPGNREDLADHLIPSRHSSMRYGPGVRASSRGRSSSIGVSARSTTAESVDISNDLLTEEAFEEDSTLRRIRELQQAKEKRHNELRKDSKRSERSSKRSHRKRSKASTDDSMKNSQLQRLKPTLERGSDSDLTTTVSIAETFEPDTSATITARKSGVPSPSLKTLTAVPSPALSDSRRYKRPLSMSKRRSSSSPKPNDDARIISQQVETFLAAPRLTQKLRHPRTGRVIAFSEVGDPDGYAVFCCVGMGLTRYVTSFYDDIARTQKLRLITPDRPGIGESAPFPDNTCTPLAWVDDIAIICESLKIDKFSLLAHSAGAIYALAAALKMPDRVRGRIHLLAPWIPPSQFHGGKGNKDVKTANLPMAHKLLSVLPAPFLRAANSRFLSSTSASIETRGVKAWKKDRTPPSNYDVLLAEMAADMQPTNLGKGSTSLPRHGVPRSETAPTLAPPPYQASTGLISPPHSPSPSNLKRHFSISTAKLHSPTPNEGSFTMTSQAKQALFDAELTHRTWALATLNANPAVDLLICLERRRQVGFKYVDVSRSVVIHHGRDDTRVPLENTQWLSKVMKRCELRVIENEGHGLMASANVMSKVLIEIGREWEEYEITKVETEQQRRNHE